MRVGARAVVERQRDLLVARGPCERIRRPARRAADHVWLAKLRLREVAVGRDVDADRRRLLAGAIGSGVVSRPSRAAGAAAGPGAGGGSGDWGWQSGASHDVTARHWNGPRGEPDPVGIDAGAEEVGAGLDLGSAQHPLLDDAAVGVEAGVADLGVRSVLADAREACCSSCCSSMQA